MSNPRRAAEFLQAHLDDGDFMVPANEGDINTLAVIHALRATADGMKRIAEQQDESHRQMTAALAGIHEIDKRLAIIEANSLTHRVEALDTRVQVLEDERQRRLGAVGLVDWISRNWPLALASIGVLVYLVLNGGVEL
jgi:polyhydroxyalkanoate synthesis regulator phasin